MPNGHGRWQLREQLFDTRKSPELLAHLEAENGALSNYAWLRARRTGSRVGSW